MSRADKAARETAMKGEVMIFKQKAVWFLVNLPTGTQKVAKRWVCQKKHKANESVDRYKVWLRNDFCKGPERTLRTYLPLS